MNDPTPPSALPARGALLRPPADLPPLSRYFSDEEFLRAHPDPGTPIYHSAEHSLLVRLLAFELAKADGLDNEQARFVSEVALFHDWDPEREVGTPARVPSTVRRLARDFVGKRPLLPGLPQGSSVLKERFGWSKAQVNMAIAMIYRTEFPFEGDHPNPYYHRTSPAERYRRSLHILDPVARRFVLRQAPLLSKYADQMSWYATQEFPVALRAVEGLVEELNDPQRPTVTTQELNTGSFLHAIGDERSLEVDLRIAREFGVQDFELPSHDEVLASLPDEYRRTFRANHAAFDAYDQALIAGEEEAAAQTLAQATFRRELGEH